MTGPRVFVALSTFAEYGEQPVELLKRSGAEVLLNSTGKRLTREQLVEMGRDAEGIIAGVEPYDAYVLESMPKLRCISRCGVGLDNIDLPKAAERGIAVLNTPDVVVQPAAELTIAMILDLLRKLTWHTTMLRSKRWTKRAGHLISGTRVGVLGLGRIGKRVAELLVKLGADVQGADLFPDREWADRVGVKVVSIDALLATSDIITIHVSILEDQKFVLGSSQIEALKNGACVVNVSRGEVIDEAALYDAMKSGRLGGAAFDVFSKEPYDGPLCELDNVILTPHVATLTEESRVQMEVEAVENLIRFFQAAK